VAVDFAATLADQLDPPDNAFEKLGYEPTCKPRVEAKLRGDLVLPEPCGRCPQELFHAATEDDILYGGAAGGGKTCSLVMEAVRACARYPRIRVLILRRTYDELAESVYPEFEQIDWAAALGGRWNKTEKEVTFPNRSVIRLRYMDNLEDASKRQGGAYQLLLVDERTLMPPGVVDVIALERLRSAHGVPVLGIRSTSNPGGPSHGECKDRYIDATGRGEKIVTTDQGLTVRFIPARATDNPHLDKAYFRRLDAIKDPARRAAMRDGDWGQFAGQMFPEIRWDRHTVAPFALPGSWRRYSTVDWGFSKPWAVLWGAVDGDGRAWAYREIYETGVLESDQAKQILEAEAEGEQVALRLADDAMWATRGEAKPIAHVYADNGVHLTPAGKGPGSRIAGWQRIHTYLADGPACPHHRALGWDLCPMIHFFRTLTKTWWELENLPHAVKGDPEDANSDAPDHLMDDLRYWLLNLGSGPEFVIPDEPPKSLAAELGVPPYESLGQQMIVRKAEGTEGFWDGGEDEDVDEHPPWMVRTSG